MQPEQPVGIPAHFLDRLRELREELQPRVPEEVRFAIGLKQTGGEFTDEVALVVYVPEKKPREELPDEQVVPARYGDLPTDVVEYRPTPIADNSRADPLVGGVRIATPPVPDAAGTLLTSHSGTLGGLTRDRLNGTLTGMTCGHVVGGSGQQGLAIHQPQQGAAGSQIGTVRASVFQFIGGPTRDWASIALDGTRGVDFSVKEIARVTGLAQPQLFDVAKKRGARTLLTSGTVVRMIPDVAGLTVEEFEVATFPFGGVFADHGDSGSWILNGHDQVTGLLFALNVEIRDAQGTAITTTGLALTMDRALADLNLEVGVKPTVTSVSPDTIFGAAAAFGQVVIDGFGFDSGSQVSFGGVPVLFSTFVGPTRIQTTPPLGLSGTVDVRVTNRWGDVSDPAPAARFTY